MTPLHNSEIKQTLSEMLNNKSISQKLYKYLYIEEPRVPSLYLLPKIHKGPLPPQGHPILSANECATERISAFVDFYLKPEVKEIPSYIKDTTDFIQKIESLEPLPEHTLLVTLDVQSLYTNIPTTEGIRSSARALLLEYYTVETPRQTPTHQTS